MNIYEYISPCRIQPVDLEISRMKTTKMLDPVLIALAVFVFLTIPVAKAQDEYIRPTIQIPSVDEDGWIHYPVSQLVAATVHLAPTMTSVPITALYFKLGIIKKLSRMRKPS